ncbi:hypothetical protein [Methanosarcina siciliae]|uniref:hypothetical protein n=1 Tax=Methanosarcina siciliae TaxID=38027 RepID=UPI00064FCAD5|nr:hypothetical protein [Methanosarcina siciliae]
MAEEEYILDDSSDSEIIYSPVCTLCKHFRRQKEIKFDGLNPIHEHKCDAFPDRIPDEIWRGDNDHKKPFPGDHGIQFEHV